MTEKMPLEILGLNALRNIRFKGLLTWNTLRNITFKGEAFNDIGYPQKCDVKGRPLITLDTLRNIT